MGKYIDVEQAVGMGYLSDWYQNSIMDNVPPVWTDEHLEELTNDFIVIPKDTPIVDVEATKHGKWSRGTEPSGSAYAHCSACNRKMNSYCYGYAHCPLCGARMDGE